jgi:peptide deformylase
MRLKILQVGETVLRRPAKALSAREIRSREFQELIESMRETMQGAPGVGLAAPQIGVPLQLAVIEDKPEYTKEARPEFLKERERQPVPFQVIVNPKILADGEQSAEFFEGCLSLAGFTALVSRARAVTVECLNEKGAPKVIHASGWYARILQHEMDHLEGSLYIDRMETRTFMSVDNFNLFWKDKPIEEVLELCGLKR